MKLFIIFLLICIETCGAIGKMLGHGASGRRFKAPLGYFSFLQFYYVGIVRTAVRGSQRARASFLLFLDKEFARTFLSGNWMGNLPKFGVKFAE